MNAATHTKASPSYLTLRGLGDPAVSNRRRLAESAHMWALGMFNDENDPSPMFEDLRWDEIVDAARSDRSVWQAFMAWQQFTPTPPRPAVALHESAPAPRTSGASNGGAQKMGRTPRRGAVSL